MSTNDDYTKAMQVIADMDKDVVSKAKDIITAWIASTSDVVKNLDEIRTSLPPAPSPYTLSSNRTQIENIYNQVNGFYQQMLYQSSALEAMMDQYNTKAA